MTAAGIEILTALALATSRREAISPETLAFVRGAGGDELPGVADRPCEDVPVLASLLGLGPDGALGERVVVDGFWSSPDDVQVQILSALVPPAEADIAARALAAAHPFNAWLPTAEHDVDDDPEAQRPPRREFDPLEPWIVRRDASVKLDQHDPLRSPSGARPLPAGGARHREPRPRIHRPMGAGVARPGGSDPLARRGLGAPAAGRRDVDRGPRGARPD